MTRSKSVFIEQEYYDSGRACIRLCAKHPGDDTDTRELDRYVDEVDDLRKWLADNLEIEPEDIAPLMASLECGAWEDITSYI